MNGLGMRSTVEQRDELLRTGPLGALLVSPHHGATTTVPDRQGPWHQLRQQLADLPSVTAIVAPTEVAVDDGDIERRCRDQLALRVAGQEFARFPHGEDSGDHLVAKALDEPLDRPSHRPVVLENDDPFCCHLSYHPFGCRLTYRQLLNYIIILII